MISLREREFGLSGLLTRVVHRFLGPIFSLVALAYRQVCNGFVCKNSAKIPSVNQEMLVLSLVINWRRTLNLNPKN